MRTVSLEQFCRGATPYGRWRAPISPQLRRGAWCGISSGGLAGALLWILPDLLEIADTPLLPLFPNALLDWGALFATHQRIAGAFVAATLLLAFGVMLRTVGFSIGTRFWQYATLGVSSIGALYGALLAAILCLVCVNALLWALMALAIIGCLAWLRRLFFVARAPSTPPATSDELQ
jgi:hypothetical protein